MECSPSHILGTQVVDTVGESSVADFALLDETVNEAIEEDLDKDRILAVSNGQSRGQLGLNCSS
jgi:hypothetical protein